MLHLKARTPIQHNLAQIVQFGDTSVWDDELADHPRRWADRLAGPVSRTWDPWTALIVTANGALYVLMLGYALGSTGLCAAFGIAFSVALARMISH
ncbi:hypothetical protein KHQ06_33395 [Nocardia tengchongensis]|uniref:Sensor domain-containing protein n=1 Tax=Nocardia tengchongensis TaxID=2055889 RepID=A0ABX8CLX2_9NOCA|nr:hypothetical protein [Nocardia tengchongensis]QVI20923.1 hypothetical protein KHQ06_33395 [Nocardia tengchongensis]